MKKLMVLSLVLAVSAMSNAAFTLAYVNDQVVVGNDAAVLGGIDVYVAGVPVAEFGAIAYAAAGRPATEPVEFRYTSGDLAGSGLPWEDKGLVQVAWSVADPQASFAAGEWFSVALPGYVVNPQGNVQIDVQDNVTGAIVSMTLGAAIPEPMTMGLLGLGALFIRKRK